MSTDNMDGEDWRPVVGYLGLYSVSSMGRVFSEVSGRIMKQQVTKSQNGSKSLVVSFGSRTCKKTFYVAKLVGMAFIGDRQDGQVYSKKNKVWHDCRAENLIITSKHDDIKLSYEKGNNKRVKNPLAKQQQPKYAWIRITDNKEFRGKELLDEYGPQAYVTIGRVAKKGKPIYGHYWEKRQIP